MLCLLQILNMHKVPVTHQSLPEGNCMSLAERLLVFPHRAPGVGHYLEQWWSEERSRGETDAALATLLGSSGGIFKRPLVYAKAASSNINFPLSISLCLTSSIFFPWLK